MTTPEEAGLLLGISSAPPTNKSPPLLDCDLFNSPDSPLNPPAPRPGQKTTISHSTSTYSSDDDSLEARHLLKEYDRNIAPANQNKPSSKSKKASSILFQHISC